MLRSRRKDRNLLRARRSLVYFGEGSVLCFGCSLYGLLYITNKPKITNKKVSWSVGGEWLAFSDPFILYTLGWLRGPGVGIWYVRSVKIV